MHRKRKRLVTMPSNDSKYSEEMPSDTSKRYLMFFCHCA